MRFLFIGSRFTLHASSPRSVALTQLRFNSLTVTSSWRDLHPQVGAHDGRTTKKGLPTGRPSFLTILDGLAKASLRDQKLCCRPTPKPLLDELYAAVSRTRA